MEVPERYVQLIEAHMSYTTPCPVCGANNTQDLITSITTLVVVLFQLMLYLFNHKKEIGAKLGLSSAPAHVRQIGEILSAVQEMSQSVSLSSSASSASSSSKPPNTQRRPSKDDALRI